MSLFPAHRLDDGQPPGPKVVIPDGPDRPVTAAPPSDLMTVALNGLTAETARIVRIDLAHFGRFLKVGSAEAALRAMVGMGYDEGNRRVAEYRDEMIAAGLSCYTIRHRLSAIRSALKKARRARLTTLCIDVQDPAKGEPPKAALTPEGWSRLLAAAEDEWREGGVPVAARNLALALLLHDSVLHRGEILALHPDDFDPSRPAIRVPARVRASKGATCWLTINEGTRDALSAWMNDRGTEPGPLFPMASTRVNRVVRELGRRAGLGAGVRPRDLRRAAIAEAFEVGREPREVQAACRLGSASHVATLDTTGRLFGKDEPHPLFARPAGVAPRRPKVCPIELRGRHEPPIVRGIPMSMPLKSNNGAQYDVLKVLIDAWPGGLTGSELRNRSGHGAAVKVFGAIRASYPELAAELDPPGGHGRGRRYRIRAEAPDALMVQLRLFN
jgi:integrase